MKPSRYTLAGALKRIKAGGIFLASTTALALFAAIPGAEAQTVASLTPLHSFAGYPTDGAGPEASLIQGADGNFYGTTYYGGTNGTGSIPGYGTIFRITSTGVLTTLYNFNNTDGSTPYAPLIQATDGNFYGVTYAGGANNQGTVFRITPSGVLTTLYSFAGSDGSNPGGGLIQATDGNFYGTTSSGGVNGSGTVFQINAGGSLTTLHAFDYTEADRPFAALTQGSDGNFYGTATYGGANGKGAIFQCTPTGTVTILHSFATTDGAQPYAPLLLARDGNFYGTTIGGGANSDGTLFEISPTGTFAVLHDFAGPEGDGPVAGLIQGNDGNFYGVSESGGSGGGTAFQFTAAGTLTMIHNFAGRDGASPEAALVLGNDGNFYGTTTFGGSGQYGTVYQLNPNGSPGTLQFSAAVSSVSESAGSVSVNVNRTGGGIGAVSVVYTTSDGSAVAGTDYTAANGTLSWADGDVADKIITVSILDRNLFNGSSKTFSIVLSAPGGGATLGKASSAMVNILDNDTAQQPTVEITSPPANITVVSGSSLALSAAVTDPAGTLSQVQFFLNDVFYSKSSSATGPFTLNAIAPLPGTYVLKAVAIDNQNRQNVSTRTVTVVAPDAANPTPMADFVSDLNGRSLGGGTVVVLTATADSLSTDGTPLQRVDFYADNTLIASYDGQGNLIAGGTSGAGGLIDTGRRTSADSSNVIPAKNGTVFTAPWGIPNLNKLVNLITVATSKSGLSQISAPLTVRTAATSATSNHPPTTAIKSVANGQRVHQGTTITVPVDVSDPDAGASSTSSVKADGNARRLHALGTPGSAIASMDYYLNKLKVASATQPPFTYDVTPPAAGTYVLEAIATDDAGLSGVAPPVTFQVVGTPVITLSIPGIDDGTANTTVAEGGPKLKILVTRTGDDLSEDVTVNYKAAGDAVSGVDYKTLAGSVTIPAGSDRAKLKVVAFDDGVADGSKLLKIKLKASEDGSYTLGTPSKAKVTILDVEGQ